MKPAHNTSTLAAIALPQPAEPGAVPEWIQIVPKGRVSAYDGRGPFWYDNAAEVIEASFSGSARIVIDANHSTETIAKLGGDAPAHGYVVAMEERDDGIWGRVDWNPSGTALMQNRSYWGVSPVLAHQSKTGGKIIRIKNVALTNDPGLRELASLNSANMENGMDFLKQVADALGLTEGASEQDVLSAIKDALEPKEQADTATTLSAVTTALGLTDGASQTELVAAVTALSAANAQITTLQAKLTALEETGKKRDAETWLAGHRAKGRAIPTGTEELYTRLHMENAERAEQIVQTLPVLAETRLGGKPPRAESITTLSAEQKAVASQLGLDHETYLAELQVDAKEKEAV